MCRTSQFDIETILDTFYPQGHGATFIEIGCWDGKHISNTHYLEKEKKWTGVCVDPFPRNFNTRKCLVLHKAVSKDGLPRPFIRVYHDKRDMGDVSYFSGFVDTTKAHIDLIKKHCHYEIIDVETITMEKVLDAYRHHTGLPQATWVDFLSVDTEGSEFEILSSIDYNKWEFGIITFEHNGNSWAQQKIKMLLEPKGYVLYKRLVIDDVYVHPNLINKLNSHDNNA